MNSSSTIATKSKIRLSNIEALRIISMFLVLIVHADFFSFGPPSSAFLKENPIFGLGQYFFESISIVCVNVFILISGWFGINASIKGFAKFIFQCLFFLVGIFVVCLSFGLIDFTVSNLLKGIAGCLVMLKWNWFIKAYIGLFIFAPVLNAFINNAGKKSIEYFLISFYIFQTLYSWFSNSAEFLASGYSTISFAGLYILARYAKLYPNKLTQKTYQNDLLMFSIITLFMTITSFSAVYFTNNQTLNEFLMNRMFNYTNPLVIASSQYLLLAFSKMNFQSGIINKIAASSFAVFLLHTNPNLCKQYFIPTIHLLNKEFSGILFLITTLLFLISVFFVAILIDQLRIYLWNKIEKSTKVFK